MRGPYLLVLVSVLMSGCVTHKASVSLSAIDPATLMPVSGARAIDARSNLVLATVPDRVTLYQRGRRPMTLPMVLRTRCGNTYFEFVVIEKWGRLEAPDYEVDSRVVFELDGARETCVDGVPQ